MTESLSVDPEAFAARFPQIARSEDDVTIAALVDTLTLHEAGAGEALVAQGTPSDELFLVLDGRLDISIATANGERRLAAVDAGQMFGEMSLLDPAPAGASVITEQGCTVLRIGRARLDSLRREQPVTAAPLLREVIRSLAARLQDASSFASGLESR
jgi:CRP/FNR family transcriptional regulator, cyclic AMP receptor protein